MPIHRKFVSHPGSDCHTNPRTFPVQPSYLYALQLDKYGEIKFNEKKCELAQLCESEAYKLLFLDTHLPTVKSISYCGLDIERK